MKKFFQIVFIFIFAVGFSQKTQKIPLQKYEVAQLPEQLKESSGLNFFNDQLYSFNDSGNSSELFQIDKTTGQILRSIPTGLKNKDWEALTNDGENFYIADFGNNGGGRKDLVIYKAPFIDGKINKDSIKTISFYYPEQTDFTFKNINNNFDAEAIVFANHQLHIFTKEWVSKGVSHYTIDPIQKESIPAKKIDFFQTNFVVTDAAYFKSKLYLIGYTKKLKVFLQIFEETQPGIFFKGKNKKYKLGNTLKLGQIEGISVNDSGIFISGEEFNFPLKNSKQKLYLIPNDIITL